MEFFYLCQKLCWRLAGVSFYGPCSTWRAGRLDQVILLVWPKEQNFKFPKLVKSVWCFIFVAISLIWYAALAKWSC